MNIKTQLKMDDKNERIDVARQVMLILGAEPMTVRSWGFNRPSDVPDGLEFYVRGCKFCGKVQIVYNAEYDSFDVTLLLEENVVKTIRNVLFTSLIESVDREIETA